MAQTKRETKHVSDKRNGKLTMSVNVDSTNPTTESYGLAVGTDRIIDGKQAPILITPTNNSIGAKKHAETPDTVATEESTPLPRDEEYKLVRQLDESTKKEKKSIEELDKISEAIRTLTRLMQRCQTSGFDASSPARDVLTTPLGEKIILDTTNPCLIELADQLEGHYGSDFQGLVNTVNMVLSHGQLTSEEAAELVEEIQSTQRNAEEAIDRYEKAEAASLELSKHNKVLRREVKRLRSQRKILSTEVKELRKRLEESKQMNSFVHLLGSMYIHETYLKDIGQTQSGGCMPEGNDKGYDTLENDHEEDIISKLNASTTEDKVRNTRFALFVKRGTRITRQENRFQEDGKSSTMTMSDISNTSCFIERNRPEENASQRNHKLRAINKLFSKGASTLRGSTVKKIDAGQLVQQSNILDKNNENHNLLFQGAVCRVFEEESLNGSKEAVFVTGRKQNEGSAKPTFINGEEEEIGPDKNGGIAGNSIPDNEKTEHAWKPISEHDVDQGIYCCCQCEDDESETFSSPRTRVGPGMYLV